MDATGPTLLRRALAVLQAKQYLAFYAIPIYALAALVPLALSWLHEGGPAEEVVGRVQAPLYDVAAAPGLVALGVFVVYLLVFVWFRAGYIRSIVGRLHLRPQDGGQFASLLGLQLLIEATTGAAVLVIVMTDDATVATVTDLVLFGVFLAIMYADYAIVITGLGPMRAIARSWACMGANLLISATVAVTVRLTATAVAVLVAQMITGGLAQALPLLVIDVAVMGLVTFIADVILVVTYIHAVETGRLPRAR
jgi:hypothetical protein